MIIHRPKDCTAGFMCRAEPKDCLPFLELGEVYASSSTQVDSHQNHGWEICLQTKGHSEWTVKGEKASMGELSSYLIRPGIEHRSNAFAEEECHFYFVVFRDECIPEILKDRPEWNQDYLFSEESGDLILPFQNLIREMSIPKKWRRHACRLALQQLCIAFSRTHLTKSDHRRSWLDFHPAAVRAMTLLESQPDYPWRTEELAKEAGVSVPHLCEHFRKAYGESPYQCLMRMRIEESKRRLTTTDLSITHIAVDLGFASGQHFSRIFKQRTGSTPRQFRNAQSNQTST